MTIISDRQSYRLIRSDGVEIMRGDFADAMRHVPQSHAAMNAETAIAAHRGAEARNKLTEIRNDDLDKREAAVEAREQQAFSDKVRSFADAVDRLASRIDAAEQRRIQAVLDSAPDFDNPASHGDNLQSPLPPSEPAHEERLSAMSGERPPPDAEDALADQGDVPPEIASAPRIFRPGEPERADMSVAARHGFLRRADFKAWRRQQRKQGVHL
jgi:hypothetical protein